MGTTNKMNIKFNTLFLITLILSISLVATNSITSENESNALNTESEELQVRIPGGYWNIVGPTGLCVSARNRNGRLVQQNCNQGSDMMWTAQRHGSGYIVRSRNGRVIDNAGRGSRNGNPILGYQQNNTPAQIWAIESVHNGDHVHFRNLQRNKCLDDTGRKGVNQKYHLWSCSNGNKNQWFRLAAWKATPVLGRVYPAGWWNIVGPTGLCVSAKHNNGRLVQDNCGNRSDLLWTAQRHGNGLIILNRTGRAMDNSARRGNNGNPILGYRRNNTPAQIWAIESVRHGNHVHFRNIQRNKCLDDTGRKAVGQRYHLWSCSNGNKNQWFRLMNPRKNNNLAGTMKIPSGRWFNLVGPSGLCVEYSRRKDMRLVQRPCNHENDLQWQFIRRSNGYIIRNRQHGYVIDNSGAKNRNGNPIIGYRLHGKPNQIWAPQSVNGSTFLLRNPQTNRCMDATGLHGNGRLYHLWSCSKGNRNQWFRIGNPQRRPIIRPRPMPRPMPRPIAIPTVVPAPVTPAPAPMPQWGATYPIAFFKPTPGHIDMDTLRN